MIIKKMLLVAFVFSVAGCATQGSISTDDSRYPKISQCGGSIATMIAADVTLQLRIENDARGEELSPQLKSLVNKKAIDHPSAEYLKIIISDIGIVGLKKAIARAPTDVADMMAVAKLKHSGDLVKALEEILPRLEIEAQYFCRDSGYKFTALKRISSPASVMPSSTPNQVNY
jgi:hypothetical protein